MKGFKMGKMFKMPKLGTGLNMSKLAGVKKSDLGLDLGKDLMPKAKISIKFKDV